MVVGGVGQTRCRCALVNHAYGVKVVQTATWCACRVRPVCGAWGYSCGCTRLPRSQMLMTAGSSPLLVSRIFSLPRLLSLHHLLCFTPPPNPFVIPLSRLSLFLLLFSFLLPSSSSSSSSYSSSSSFFFIFFFFFLFSSSLFSWCFLDSSLSGRVCSPQRVNYPYFLTFCACHRVTDYFFFEQFFSNARSCFISGTAEGTVTVPTQHEWHCVTFDAEPVQVRCLQRSLASFSPLLLCLPVPLSQP